MEANCSVLSWPACVSTNSRGIVILFVATLLVLLAAHLSPAGQAARPPVQNVVYGYGEVTDAGRVPALYRRFEREALDLCERVAGVALQPQAECVERVVDRAVRTIDAPALTAYHENKGVRFIYLVNLEGQSQALAR